MEKATILLVEDDSEFSQRMIRSFGSYRITVKDNLEAAFHTLKEKAYSLVLLDLSFASGHTLEGLKSIAPLKKLISDTPLIVITEDQQSSTNVEAIKRGADNFLRKDEFNIVAWKELFDQHIAEAKPNHLIGESPVLLKVQRDLVQLSTDSSSPILLIGESGVGKAGAARYFHNLSKRVTQPFLAINLSLLPDLLHDTYLFGYRKGAFTGANIDKDGVFVQANGGTVFIEAIEVLNLRAQVKLLDILNNGVVAPIGGKEQALDIQLLCSTKKDLGEYVRQGSFNEELYEILCKRLITIPPLREREEDIKGTINYYLDRLSARADLLTDSAWQLLLQYSWPRNIRQVINVLRKICAKLEFEELPFIDIQHLPENIKNGKTGQISSLDAFEQPILVISSDQSYLSKIQNELSPIFSILAATSEFEVIQLINRFDSIGICIVAISSDNKVNDFQIIEEIRRLSPFTKIITIAIDNNSHIGFEAQQLYKIDFHRQVSELDFRELQKVIDAYAYMRVDIDDLIAQAKSSDIHDRQKLQLLKQIRKESNDPLPETEEEIERIQLIETIDSTFILNRLQTPKAFFFKDLNWNLSERVNVLLGKNGFGKTFLIRLLSILAHRDSKVIIEEDSLRDFSMTLEYTRDEEKKTLLRGQRGYSGTGFQVPILALGALRFFPRKSEEAKSEEYNRIKHLFYEASMPFRTAQREVERSELLFIMLIKSYESHAAKLKSNKAESDLKVEKVDLDSIPIFKLTKTFINQLTDLNFDFHSVKLQDRFGPSVAANTVMDILVTSDQHIEAPISLRKMSMGTQSVLYLFATIYSYLETLHEERFEEFRHEQVQFEHAVILIDEIDAHLHPDWQQRIVWILRNTFPNVQFIFTAHSPLIVSGCFAGEVAILRQHKTNGFNIQQYENSFVGWNVSKLLKLVYNVPERDETFRHYDFISNSKSLIFEYIETLQSKEDRTEEEDIKFRNLKLALEQIFYVEEYKSSEITIDKLLKENKELREQETP
ncbi:MAG: sigma 54-interacting transcriptional regulator [Bacteroidota bacterium]